MTAKPLGVRGGESIFHCRKRRRQKLFLIKIGSMCQLLLNEGSGNWKSISLWENLSLADISDYGMLTRRGWTLCMEIKSLYIWEGGSKWTDLPRRNRLLERKLKGGFMDCNRCIFWKWLTVQSWPAGACPNEGCVNSAFKALWTSGGLFTVGISNKPIWIDQKRKWQRGVWLQLIWMGDGKLDS